VIKKSDSGCDRGTAFAVKVDGNLDCGFLGGPLDRRLAHYALRDAPPFIRALADPPNRPMAHLQ
jgi:hypothetical protein